MKKMLLSLAVAMLAPLAASAMSYEEAREQALFLTDKMAYELNLNSEQYEYCYEINLDYLMGVETADDVYGHYLTYRNADLRHILFDWQYAIFSATDYFFHPLIWHRGVWSLPIYRHYAYGHFFYDRPHVYLSYRGGHGRFYFGGGYYGNRRPHWNGGFRGHDRGPLTHRGDFNRGGGRMGSRDGGRIGGREGGHVATRGGMNSGRSGSFGRNNNGRIGGSSDGRIGNSRDGHIGNTRSSAMGVSRPSVGSSSHSVGSGRATTNDARPGSFSRGGSSYSHPSSTRSISSHNSGSMRSSSPSMGGSRSSSMGGSRGGSMGSSRGGAMGGSHGGGHGRGR